VPRENAQAKATRLLTEARVSIVRVDDRGTLAFVKGDSGMMRRVTFDGAQWRCDCPALGYCSHGIAVARVVVVPGAWISAPDVLASAGAA
jgi:uncharacterized Zn finger protein